MIHAKCTRNYVVLATHTRIQIYDKKNKFPFQTKAKANETERTRIDLESFLLEIGKILLTRFWRPASSNILFNLFLFITFKTKTITNYFLIAFKRRPSTGNHNEWTWFVDCKFQLFSIVYWPAPRASRIVYRNKVRVNCVSLGWIYFLGGENTRDCLSSAGGKKPKYMSWGWEPNKQSQTFIHWAQTFKLLLPSIYSSSALAYDVVPSTYGMIKAYTQQPLVGLPKWFFLSLHNWLWCVAIAVYVCNIRSR